MSNIINELLENNIIEKSTSHYASRAMLVPKKNGEFRLVIDYRELNQITIRETFPVPNIEESLHNIRHSKYYMVMDMMNGYHQIPVKNSSRYLTAFVTTAGHYQYKRMPFGLTNAPAVFLRLMDILLSQIHCKNIVAYMDDIILFGDTFDEIMICLGKLLTACEQLNLTFSIAKCSFFNKEIIYLGHKINAQGIHPGQLKTEAIERFRVPTTCREVKQFLGLTGYFRRFVLNYAIIANPLNSLLKKDAKFKWGEEEKHAFEFLKKKLCSEPVLTIYNPNLPHELHTDACQIGLAGILIQIENDNNRVVGYFSRCTSESEQKYHSFELETLALVESLIRFKYYLMGKRFVVYTDCNSLKQSISKKELVPRIARWLLKIQEFDFEVIHCPGNKMAHADALSRCPAESPKEVEEAGLEIRMIGMEEIDWVSTLQQQDGNIRKIMETLLQGKDTDKQLKSYEKEYKVKNYRLYKITPEGDRFVVPCGVRWRIIKSAHDDVGHCGMGRTVERIKKLYWFPKLNRIVQKYINSCPACLYNKRGVDETRYHIHYIEKRAIPFYTIHIDHVGPFPRSKHGNEHLIGIIDSFTKFIILKPVPSTKTNYVLKSLHSIADFVGYPKQIISDNGSAFTSKSFQEFCTQNYIKHILTAVRTPRANGQIERYFRVVNRAISSMSQEEDGRDWDKHVSAIQWGINSIEHSTTKQTPQQLLFSFTPFNSLGNHLSLALNDESDDDEEDISLSELRERARKKVVVESKKRADNFNKLHKAPQKYEENDLVLLKAENPATGTSRKLLARYKGPYMVKKVLGNDRYLIGETDSTQVTQKPYEAVHAADKMKPWCSLTDFDELDVADDNIVDHDDENNDFHDNDIK